MGGLPTCHRYPRCFGSGIIKPSLRSIAAILLIATDHREMRMVDGAPFAGTGLFGLSKLSLGWMKMGIVHERIQPGRPQQNGRYERMHRTLKEDTTNPAALTLRLQQRKFDRFRQMFNHERPHGALNNATPGSLYQPSSVMLPRTLIRSVSSVPVPRIPPGSSGQSIGCHDGQRDGMNCRAAAASCGPKRSRLAQHSCFCAIACT
jgi:hypothetical protein